MSDSQQSVVLTDVDSGVAQITLNRPDRMNAFTWRMGNELNDALVRFDQDDSVRAIVVTGSGRAFCAGADLAGGGKTFDGGGRGEASQDARDRGPVDDKARIHPWQVRKPIIAAINGPAVGVGLTIPLQYDMRIVAEDAKLGFVFVQRGIMPELASTWILPRLIGMARASELLLSGRILRGREAAELGLCNEALPKEEVLPRALELARYIAVNSAPVSVALTKQLIWENLGVSNPGSAQRREAKPFAWIGSQPDAREGVLAFLEKRDPEWSMQPSKDVPEIDPLS